LAYRRRQTGQYQPRKPTVKAKAGAGRPLPKRATVEVRVGDQTVLARDFAYAKEGDLDLIRKALAEKAKKELDLSRRAEVTISFPKSRRKPIRFEVAGGQPLQPRIIHHPSWPPPEELAAEIREEIRKNPKRKTASDLEAMAYLHTASLATPLSDDMARIYFHLFRKYLTKKGWRKFKGTGLAFLDQYKRLEPNEERELKKLKDWIYQTQQRDLEERRRQLKSQTA
jgi:hypothetical protein